MNPYSSLIRSALLDPDCAAVVPAIQNSSVRFSSWGLQASTNAAGLEAILEKHPEYMEQLVSAGQTSTETACKLLTLKHKPSLKVANRIAKHPEKLTDYAIDYVMEHGGKAALRDLMARHQITLTLDQMHDVQDILFTKHKLLFTPSLPNPKGKDHAEVNWVKDQIERNVDFLTKATDKHQADKYFRYERRAILITANLAGVPIPDDVLGDYELLTADEILQGIWSVINPNHGAISMDASTSSWVWLALQFNKDVLEEFSKLPLEQMVEIYADSPTWPALERITTAAAADTDYSLSDFKERLPVLLSEGFPTMDVLEALPPHIRGRGTGGLVVTHLHELFGEDNGKWTSFATLYDDWEGTLGDLIETVVSIHS